MRLLQQEKSNSKRALGLTAALALVGQLGFVMGLPIAGGVIAGNYLDHHFGFRGVFQLAGALAGLVLGLGGAFRILSKIIEWKS